jgi:hypothetical protein
MNIYERQHELARCDVNGGRHCFHRDPSGAALASNPPAYDGFCCQCGRVGQSHGDVNAVPDGHGPFAPRLSEVTYPYLRILWQDRFLPGADGLVVRNQWFRDGTATIWGE